MESRWKSDGTRVTAVDVAISENIFRALNGALRRRPVFQRGASATEGPIPVTSQFSWVLDPIDGTNNFALGIPHCAISLALIEHGEPVYGVVYDFSRRLLMHGGPGFGVFDGDASQCVSPGAADAGDPDRLPQPMRQVARSRRRTPFCPTSRSGAWAARRSTWPMSRPGFSAGAVDFNVKIWDLAAAIPLCRAAGGEVIFLNGEQLPMKVFDLKMNAIIYAAGAPAMADAGWPPSWRRRRA